jgi:colanic acid biosynthesis glycosyl transferase WcaI
VTGVPHYPEWRRMPAAPLPDRENLKVRRYTHFIPRRPSAFGRMLYEASWLLSASRGVVAARVDAAIGVVPTLSGGVLAYLAARRFRVPMGLVFQDLMGLAASQSGYQGGRRVAGAISRVEGFLVRRADQIAVISDGFKPYLDQLGVSPSRVTRVRNWSHLDTPSEPVESARARLGWAPTDFVCLHAGNIGHKQGLDNLLDAASLLSDRQVKFVIAGEGNDRDRLVGRARALGLRNVVFIGLQPTGQFESMLQAADVLVLNQRGTVADFALPSKLSAYLLAGRPVVAAIALGSNAASEFSAAGGGVAVPPDDPRALVEAITHLKNSPDVAQTLGARGRAYALQHLVASQALAQYDGFVDRLLEDRRR